MLDMVFTFSDVRFAKLEINGARKLRDFRCILQTEPVGRVSIDEYLPI